ncbi:MAG: phosphoribosylglycinamide formyltransferase [Bdellovibrionota bacterium]
MSRKTPIAILASGRGSNFEAILHAVTSGSLSAKIVAVVSDQRDAPVLHKAKVAGIDTFYLPVQETAANVFERRKLHEAALLKMLEPFSPYFLVMAGYMRVVSGLLIDRFNSNKGYARIVNIHPSLLPAFPGVDAYAKAYRFGAKVTGVTMHLIDETLDGGPICAQESFSISDCRSELEVEQRGLVIEHRLYPETLKWVLAEEFTIERNSKGGRLCVRKN